MSTICNADWQRSSKYVAYVHLIFASVLLTISAVMLVLVVMGLIAVDKPYYDYRRTNDRDFMVDGVMTVVSIILLCLDLWAASLLVKATKQGLDPEKALNKTQVWKNVCSAFLLVCILYNLFTSNFLALTLESSLRSGMLYIVYKFIDELEAAVYDVPPGDPTMPFQIPFVNVDPSLLMNEILIEKLIKVRELEIAEMRNNPVENRNNSEN